MSKDLNRERIWIARDTDGELKRYKSRPSRHPDGHWVGDWPCRMSQRLFPDIKPGEAREGWIMLGNHSECSDLTTGNSKKYTPEEYFYHISFPNALDEIREIQRRELGESFRPDAVREAVDRVLNEVIVRLEKCA